MPSDRCSGELLDREIMLACLAAAADAGCDSDLRRGKPARRILDARRRGLSTRRRALLEREAAHVGSPGPTRPPGPSDDARFEDIASRLTLCRLVLNLTRGDLAARRHDAADLRASSRALRAEAQQIRRRREP